MKNILLTGAKGFVGNAILKKLLNEDINIKLLLRKKNSEEDNTYKNCTSYYVNDIFSQSFEWWLNMLSNVDTIIHSAWYTEPDKYLMSKKNIDCLEGSITMIRAAAKAKVKSFVGIGTCYEYDFKYCNKPLSIDTPLNPKSPYSLAKVSLLNTLKAISIISEMDYSWCRLFYLYGEGEHKSRLIPYIHNQMANSKTVLLSKGDKIRDYMDISDAAKLISLIALNRASGVHNICSGEGKTIKQIALEIADFYGKRELIRFGEKESKRFEPDKIIGTPTSLC